MSQQRTYPTAHQQWSQGGMQYPQPHPEAVFVNMPSRETSVNKITMPVLMFFGAAVVLIGVTYAATSQLNDLRYAIEKLTTKMDQIASDLTSRINRLEDGTRDRWTKADHEYWCARTEQINTDNGWRCAENPGQPRRESARRRASDLPIWGGITIKEGKRK